jgi:hypothetical protein
MVRKVVLSVIVSIVVLGLAGYSNAYAIQLQDFSG